MQPLDGPYVLGVYFRESNVLHPTLHPLGIPIVMQTYGLPIVARQLGLDLTL
jgi:hypothetical protein